MGALVDALSLHMSTQKSFFVGPGSWAMSLGLQISCLLEAPGLVFAVLAILQGQWQWADGAMQFHHW